MTDMLSPGQLAELSQQLGANADRLIDAYNQKNLTIVKQQPKQKSASERRGRPPKRIANPFVGHVGPATEYGRYPAFTLDIIEGISRLNWHDRKEGSTETAKPLSVSVLMDLFASVEEITAATVKEFTGLELRQSQRYVKAIELAMPHVLASRPQRLIDAMGSHATPEDCPIYLRRMYVEKTYRALSGGVPLDGEIYCLLGQYRKRSDSTSYADADGLPRRISVVCM
ncbi:hypothetical protein [Pseudomonas sp. HLS-6]|uniref:hypothetical protein n=1 Tax=Pseudomonas sp. HLS-6 TaxID=2049589 RepID=UPI0012FE4F32|nr:hypothetical protein [Pseudomonas sp. HLS-6]